MHDVLVRLVPEGARVQDLLALDEEMKRRGYRSPSWGGPSGLYEYWIRTPASLAWIRMLATRMARRAGVFGRVVVSELDGAEMDEAA